MSVHENFEYLPTARFTRRKVGLLETVVQRSQPRGLESIMSENQQYPCGHCIDVSAANDLYGDFWKGGLDFDCPDCQKQKMIAAGIDPTIYINMQKISAAMVAFVVEIQGVQTIWSELLTASGYVLSPKSQDEFTRSTQDEEQQVWRKEYWFASDTHPRHVTALLIMLKQEMRWLACYLPRGKSAVDFWDFPA